MQDNHRKSGNPCARAHTHWVVGCWLATSIAYETHGKDKNVYTWSHRSDGLVYLLFVLIMISTNICEGGGLIKSRKWVCDQYSHQILRYQTSTLRPIWSANKPWDAETKMWRNHDQWVKYVDFRPRVLAATWLKMIGWRLLVSRLHVVYFNWMLLYPMCVRY